MIEYLPVILSVLGMFVSAAAMLSQRKVNDADYAAKVSKAATDLLAPYQEELNTLHAENKQHAAKIQQLENNDKARTQEISRLQQLVEEMQTLIDELLSGIDRLVEQISCLGQTPVWLPNVKRRKPKK